MRVRLAFPLLLALLAAGPLASAAPSAAPTLPSTLVLARGVRTPSAPAAEAGSWRSSSPYVSSPYVKSGVRGSAGDGEWYTDAQGVSWLGKAGKGDPDELDRMGNATAVSAIYRLASDTFGTAAPELRIATIDGKPYLLSKKVALSDAKTFNDEQLRRFGDGFIVDAWMANWDVGGAWQLTADASGRPLRIDGAGAGLFRAHGEPKGAALGDEVTELQTMRDPLRPISYGFRKVSERGLKEQLQKFATWYPAHRADVETLIDQSGLRPAAATTLKTKLAARAQWLIRQTYPAKR